jgi:type VI secretion system (T6SS) effector TldE1-like protein
MALLATIADALPSASSSSWSAKTARVVAALTLALGSAALIAHFDPATWFSPPAFSKPADPAPFDARFFPGSVSRSLLLGSSSARLAALTPEVERKLQEAKGLLAQKLQALDWQPPVLDQPANPGVASVPLPRSRPIEASLESAGSSLAAQVDNRTLLQKLSDLFPPRITLASLSPDGGLVGSGPDLTSLGYDNLTAVYDISARAVYLPNGSKLEAHSGFGRLMDDPNHVSERMVGATPPTVYDLKLRERLFHGIEAIRMIPVDGNATLGRSGLLAHSYMLGPNGDSNGCVSIKDYERFLKAFKDGEIRRLVVVPSLDNPVLASRTSS